jgi:hypothetical protein
MGKLIPGATSKVCPKCKIEKVLDDYHNNTKAADGKASWCKSCEYEKSKQLAQNKKILVFEKYGGCVCVCCGESEISFLTIDHINGNGNRHRREIFNGKTSYRIYPWLIKNNFPPGFQVLCFNCNCGKQVNGGTCPHKDMKEEK